MSARFFVASSMTPLSFIVDAVCGTAVTALCIGRAARDGSLAASGRREGKKSGRRTVSVNLLRGGVVKELACISPEGWSGAAWGATTSSGALRVSVTRHER